MSMQAGAGTLVLGSGRGRHWLLGALALAAACGSAPPRRENSGVGSTARAAGAADTPAAAPAAPTRPTSEAPAGGRQTVVFIGTSLTAGLGLDPDSAYPARIQRKIAAAGLPFDVVNAGVSGETSADLLRRLNWLVGQRMDVVVLETGANDGLRGTSVRATRGNIQQAIQRIRATHPAATVLLVQMEALPNLGSRYTRAFHAMYPEVARATGIRLLPFLLNRVAGHASLNQGDGLHPNDVGERMVADNVWAGLEPVLRSLAGFTR